MNLIKKIVACSLALTVAFGGICATAAELGTKGQNPVGISPKAQKGIIGGTCAVGGTGALALLIWGFFKYRRSNETNILIIRSDKALGDKFVQEIKTPDVLKNFLEQVGSKLERVDDYHWNVKQCAPNDPKAREWVAQADVIFKIITSDTDARNINCIFGDSSVPHNPNQKIINISHNVEESAPAEEANLRAHANATYKWEYPIRVRANEPPFKPLDFEAANATTTSEVL